MPKSRSRRAPSWASNRMFLPWASACRRKAPASQMKGASLEPYSITQANISSRE